MSMTKICCCSQIVIMIGQIYRLSVIFDWAHFTKAW